MRQKAAVVLAAVLLLVVPEPAFALWGGGWLERLSGPGPFRGQVIDQRFLCITLPSKETEIEGDLGGPLKYAVKPLGKRGALTAIGCSVLDLADGKTSNEPRLEVGVDAQFLHSATNALDYSQPGTTGAARVGLRTLGLTADIRINSLVDIGAGVGKAWFRSTGGTPFDSFSRAVWQPLRVTVRPLAFVTDELWSEAVSFRFDATKFNGAFTAENFGARSGSYNEPGEVTWGCSFRVNLFAVKK